MTRVGVIAALEAEARCLTNGKITPGHIAPLSDHTRVLISGMGGHHATAAAERLVNDGVGALVSTGTAVGLVDNLQAGTLLLPMALVDNAGYKFDLHSVWRTRVVEKIAGEQTIEQGPLGEAVEIIGTPSRKRLLAKQLSVVAADMESAAVAKVATAAGIPLLVCRVVIDSVDSCIPGSVLAASDGMGQIQPARLAMALLRNLADLSPLIKLALAFGQSRRTLRRVSQTLGPDFSYRAPSQ